MIRISPTWLLKHAHNFCYWLAFTFDWKRYYTPADKILDELHLRNWWWGHPTWFRKPDQEYMEWYQALRDSHQPHTYEW